jgi:hypothetical protein
MVLMAGGGMGVVTQCIPWRLWRPRCSILPQAADGTGWRGGGGVDTDRGGIILGYANKQ